MDEASVTRYVTESFDGVDVVAASDGTFFFYDPGGGLEVDRTLPFATLVTSDAYDAASDLNRPSVFRLNIGAGPETYRSLFGPQPSAPGADGIVATGHDFTVLDQILPHPIYAPMSWVCVLNPSDATFQTLQPLLAEAYDLAARRYNRRHGTE